MHIKICSILAKDSNIFSNFKIIKKLLKKQAFPLSKLLPLTLILFLMLYACKK